MQNIAVIGGGRWGKNHIKTLKEIGALKAIVDTDPDRRTELAEMYPDTAIYDTIEPVLDDDSISGVSVVTPAETHFQVARSCLEAGKHTLVEKPIALYSSHAKELVKIAGERKLTLMVGHLLLFHPAIRKIKELIDSGELGSIQYIYSNRLNLGTVRKEENILWSFAPHDIAVISYLAGDSPVTVEARGGIFLQPRIHDVTVTHLTYPRNIVAHIHVSWLHPFKEQRLVVIGDKNMVMFEDTRQEDKLLLYPKGIDWKDGDPVKRDGHYHPIELSGVMPLKAECEHFLHCIKTGEQPVTDGVNGLNVLQVLETAQSSLTGKPVAQPNVGSGSKSSFFVHPTSIVDEDVIIGEGTKIWHFSHIMKGSRIGRRCIFGQNSHVADDVIIGNNVKVQNNVSIYTGTVIEDDVFLGPSCVLTNVTNPRSQVNRHALYESTLLKRGCSIGANATIVCGIEIGRYAFVAAGAVVAKDVPDYAMMMGVPARQTGWISRHGLPLRNPDKDGIMTCPESGLKYHEVEAGVLRCIDLDEEAPLPEEMSEGSTPYDDIAHSDRT